MLGRQRWEIPGHAGQLAQLALLSSGFSKRPSLSRNAVSDKGRLAASISGFHIHTHVCTCTASHMCPHTCRYIQCMYIVSIYTHNTHTVFFSLYKFFLCWMIQMSDDPILQKTKTGRDNVESMCTPVIWALNLHCGGDMNSLIVTTLNISVFCLAFLVENPPTFLSQLTMFTLMLYFYD